MNFSDIGLCHAPKLWNWPEYGCWNWLMPQKFPNKAWEVHIYERPDRRYGLVWSTPWSGVLFGPVRGPDFGPDFSRSGTWSRIRSENPLRGSSPDQIPDHVAISGPVRIFGTVRPSMSIFIMWNDLFRRLYGKMLQFSVWEYVKCQMVLILLSEDTPAYLEQF